MMPALLRKRATWIGVGPQRGCKVFTLPECDEPSDTGFGKVAGFSLHAGAALWVDERKKLERLCRYISQLVISEKRLSLTPNGNVRYLPKTPYRDDPPHVMLEPVDFIVRLAALCRNRGSISRPSMEPLPPHCIVKFWHFRRV